MAKQKIVVKVTMKNCKSSRKALQIAVSVSGVESVAILDNERIAVIGEQIDSVQLACLLRKSVGHTDLVSVGPVEEKKAVKPISIPQTVLFTTAGIRRRCRSSMKFLPVSAASCEINFHRSIETK
ncbi:hypothetical protein L6452_00565 [Arctium lappa]|uniref:Uncharacterized protein n=1 Tax=Arctium lappa TaxID=4217 RepID=A0ACB9FEI5_ARCLA|nr:hypothetical protein L6452_00565 [Arctium lappa]